MMFFSDLDGELHAVSRIRSISRRQTSKAAYLVTLEEGSQVLIGQGQRDDIERLGMIVPAPGGFFLLDDGDYTASLPVVAWMIRADCFGSAIPISPWGVAEDAAFTCPNGVVVTSERVWRSVEEYKAEREQAATA